MSINSQPNAPNIRTAIFGTAAAPISEPAALPGLPEPQPSGSGSLSGERMACSSATNATRLEPTAERRPASLADLGSDLLQVALKVNELHQNGLLPDDMSRLRRDEVYAFGLLARGFKPELIAEALRKPIEEIRKGLQLAQAIFTEPRLFA